VVTVIAVTSWLPPPRTPTGSVELVAEGVGERGVPLVHEVNRRRHDESTDASVGDGLQPEERLPAARGEYDTPRRSWSIQASSAACW